MSFFLSMYVGAGAYAGCAYYKIKGEYSHNLRKMVYLDIDATLIHLIHFMMMLTTFLIKRTDVIHPLIRTWNMLTTIIKGMMRLLLKKKEIELPIHLLTPCISLKT